MMAMSPITALAEGTGEGGAGTSTDPVEQPTSVPSVSEVVSTTGVMPAPETGADNGEQLDNANKEIGEASDALGDVKTPILSIPLEKNEEEKAEDAAKDVDEAKEELTSVETDIDNKLDQSVEGKENLGSEDSLIDDKATEHMDKAEKALGNYADLELDQVIETAEGDIDAVVTADDAKKVADGLNAAAEAAKAELETSEAELANAAKDLEKAEEDYEAALAISDEAAEKAAAELEAAKAKMAEVAEKNATLKSRVDRIDQLVDSVSGKLNEANTNLDEAIEEAKSDLAESKENLQDSVDNLKEQTEELSDAAKDFVDQVGELNDAIGAFVDAVEEAKETADNLEELRDQYEDAREAYAEAERLYKIAEENAAGIDEKKIEELKATMDAAKEAMDEAEVAMKGYEDATYEENLNKALDEYENASDVEKGDKAASVGSIVIEKYITKEGQKIEWIPANIDDKGKLLDGVTETPFGKTAEGFYVVYTENEDGTKNIVNRYGKEVVVDEETGKESLVINAIKSDSTENFYQVGDEKLLIQTEDGSEVVYVVTGEGKKLYIKKDDKGNEYFEGDELTTGSRDDYSKLPEFSYDGLAGWNDTTVTRDMYTKDEKLGAYVFTLTSKLGIECKFALYYDAENGEYEISQVFRKLSGSEYTMDTDLCANFKNPSYVQVPQVNIDGACYDLKGNETDGFYYEDSKGEHALIKKEDGSFVTKNSVTYVPGGDANTTYSMGDSTDISSDTYATVYGGLVKDYDTKKGLQAQAESEYNDAKDKYDKLQSALEVLNKAQEEVDRTDLVVTDKILFSKTDLSTLPVDLGDIISVEKILQMDQDEQKEMLGAIQELLNGKTNLSDIESISSLLKALGFENTPAMAKAIGKAITIAYPDAYPDALQSKNVTAFEKAYANAWVAAWEAKLDVVVKGIELAKQANDTATAGIKLVVEGGKEVQAIGAVTLDALEVALRAATVGGMELGSDVLTIAQKIVGNIDDYVEKLQAKVDAAAEEVREAQAALDAIKLTNPKSEELAKAEAALIAAKERFAGLALEQNKAKSELEKAQELAKEAEELTEKLVEEERKREEEEKKNQNDGENQNNDDNQNVPGGDQGGNEGGNQDDNEGGDDTAPVVAPIQNATVITDEDMEIFAQTVADQAVLGANRSNSSATKAADAEESNETAISAEGTKEVADAKKVVLDEEKETPVEIADEETALAPTIPAEEKAKMSWWWLLIIAICGATGYTWYRNHQKKVEGEDTEA